MAVDSAQEVSSSRPMMLEAFGERRTLVDWARDLPISPSILRRRIRALPAEVALSIPPKRHVDLDAVPGAPGSWTWELLPFAADPWARAFVAQHPSGATLEVVGDALGLCRERVRQVEESALRKFRASASRLGLDLSELVQTLSDVR